jgi:hypothetical protein
MLEIAENIMLVVERHDIGDKCICSISLEAMQVSDIGLAVITRLTFWAFLINRDNDCVLPVDRDSTRF